MSSVFEKDVISKIIRMYEVDITPCVLSLPRKSDMDILKDALLKKGILNEVDFNEA